VSRHVSRPYKSPFIFYYRRRRPKRSTIGIEQRVLLLLCETAMGETIAQLDETKGTQRAAVGNLAFNVLAVKLRACVGPLDRIACMHSVHKMLGYCYRRSRVVCVSVGHVREPCKKRLNRSRRVWVGESGEHKEPCIRWGRGSDPQGQWEGAICASCPAH